MTTVKQLIEALEKLPGHTVVNVINVYDGSYCKMYEWVDLEIGEYSETYDFVDLKDNPFCKDEDRKSTPTLDLGSC